VDVGDIRDYRYEVRTLNLRLKWCYLPSEERETFPYVTLLNLPALQNGYENNRNRGDISINTSVFFDRMFRVEK